MTDGRPTCGQCQDVNPSPNNSPLSEVVQVVVETGSLLAALVTPQDAGLVDDAAVQNTC